MPNVLEDVTADKLTPEYIGRRVDDWVSRVNQLFDQIDRWLPQGWSATRDRKVLMNEELMRLHNVPPRELPTMKVSHGQKPIATIEPRGLWVVGFNGRVDLRGPKGLYLLVDMSEEEGRSDWRVVPASDRGRLKSLDEKSFFEAVS
jgi:hypothetical protein